MKNTQASIEAELAHELLILSSNAFSYMDCRKAVAFSGNDLRRAGDWLVQGNWRVGKLVTWDVEALQAKAHQLQAKTTYPVGMCLDALKDCGGSEELARRKLLNLPQPWAQ